MKIHSHLLRFMQIKFPLVLTAFAVGFFLACTVISMNLLDSDFGWHVRLGEIIVRQGIVRIDPFSYTMPSYPFIDHEWLSNIIFYVFHKEIGWQGMAILFSVLAVCAVGVIIPWKEKRFVLLPAVFVSTVLVSRFAIRAQVVEWLLFSILMRIVLRREWLRKWRWVLPILMLAWVNLHGSFALGIVVIFLACISYQDVRRIDWVIIWIAICSFLVTFINPYGWSIWHEIWMQASDTSLHFSIVEWGPFWTRPDLAFASMIGLVAAFGWRYRSRLTKMQLLTAGCTFMLSLSAVRHIPLFMISIAPVTVDLLSWANSESRTYPYGEIRFQVLYRILIVFSISVFLIEFLGAIRGAVGFSEQEFYPVEAVVFLRNQQITGHIFAPYAWGGYLDWKLPEQKVFIDGRMPSFRWHAPAGEADSAFSEYRNFVAGVNQQHIIDKYVISYILLPKDNKDISSWRQFIWFSSLSNQVLQSVREGLLAEGWVRVHADARAEIYADR